MKRIIIGLIFLSILTGNLFAIKLGIVRGAVKLVLDEQNGAILLYTNNPDVEESKQTVAIFSEANKYELSRYWLKIDGISHMLAPSRDLTITANETLFGISITFTIENVASVLIDFLFFSSIPDILQDTIRMEITVTNLGQRRKAFGFKGTFDTYLGEKRNWHFSTLTNPKINSEIHLTNMSEIKWVQSSDKTTSMKFIITDSDVTPPKKIDIASRTTIFTNAWDIPITDGQKLSSFTSYNNSAIAITWEDFELEQDGEKIFSYYITTAKDGGEAAYDLSNSMLGKALNENQLSPYAAFLHEKKSFAKCTIEQTNYLITQNIKRVQGVPKIDLFFTDTKRRENEDTRQS